MTIDPKDITPQTPEKDLPEFWEALAAKKIAEEIIPEYHSSLDDQGMAIVYLFKKKAPKKGDTVNLGTASKRSTKDQVVANIIGGFCHFVITIGWDQWLLLDEDGRRALVDHELCHCEVDFDKKGNPVPKIRHHDIEEFDEIIERHGLWRRSIENTAKAMERARQMGLFDARDRRIHSDAPAEEAQVVGG